MSAHGVFDRVPLREDRAGGTTAQVDMAMITSALHGLSSGGPGLLRLHRPAPTAAFSRRDTLLDGYSRAAQEVATRGFEPVVRPTGGRLAIYDAGALVLDLVAPAAEPRRGVTDRFSRFARSLTEGLRALGVDARVGPVPGEYCPGEHSVNGAGRVKLVGTAQRLGRHGFHFGAVVLVDHPGPVLEALQVAYPLLGLSFSPATVGCVRGQVPHVTTEQVEAAVLDAARCLLAPDPELVTTP
jgi:octanoyl-[GcvH]:protein N-octanoyltransferase